MVNVPSSRAARIFVALLLILVLFAIIVFFTPPVRAAFNAWFGVARSPAETVILTPAAVTVVPIDTPAATDMKPSATTAAIPPRTPDPTLDTLSHDAGWAILKPGWLPNGYSLSDIYYDARNKMVTLSFLATRAVPGSDQLTETKQMTLVQAQTNDQIPLQVSPSASLEEVKVGALSGAYTVGGWKSEFVADPNEANGGHFQSTWISALNVQNVYWQEGGVYLVLVSADPQVTKADLIQMAASVNH